MREENFQTTVGIDTPASSILWERLESEPHTRLSLLKLFSRYKEILRGIENDYEYLSKFVLDDYLRKAAKIHNGAHLSYIENTLRTLRKHGG